ncbi:hypothetical protein [Listeria booriae]|uniref:Uncharacterized protein n=1 Tax=Listeria booriae TaxID=1552123 RepID=A0A842FFQ8_9LIST|nr:hypothetical protein [Listeria booriae]MBC1523605.1 hypothetical protein [Listeria booriae]MBC2158695.1 hypothetical protein [Listeria booriae]MBC2241856.1 hypothetical protein [Listeria booriae]
MDNFTDDDKELLAEFINEIKNNHALKNEIETSGFSKEKAEIISFVVSGIIIGNLNI